MSECQTLLDILSQLEISIEQEDWAKAEGLNNHIKADLLEAVQNVQSEKEKESLIALLQNVQALYQLFITNSNESRSKISQELKKISSDQKAANLYFKSSQYR